MGRLRYLNPFRIHDTVRGTRRILEDGGPRAVRLAGIHPPDGWIVPTVAVDIDVVSRRHGRIERLSPAFPMPFFYALAWRGARRLLG